MGDRSYLDVVEKKEWNESSETSTSNQGMFSLLCLGLRFSYA